MVYCNEYLTLPVLVLFFSGIGGSEHDGQFRFDYTYSEQASGWFKLHIMPTTWKVAQRICRIEGANIASPTIDNWNPIVETMRNKSITKLHTGINAMYTEGIFTTIEGISIESDRIPKHWAEGQPDNLNNEEKCITINYVELLSDESCDLTLPYMCFKKKTDKMSVGYCGPSDNGFSYHEKTQRCYKVHTKPRVYSEAFMTCQAEGGYLAIINSEIESEVIRDLINKYPENDFTGSENRQFYFLGFHRDWDKNGDFYTIHGETLEEAGFSSFANGQPDNAGNVEYCGTVFRNSGLNDANCASKFGYVCELTPYYLHDAVIHHNF